MAKKKKDTNYFMFILAGLLLAFLVGVFVASSGQQHITGAVVAEPEVVANTCQADGTSQMFMLEGDKYQVCQVYSCEGK